MNLWRGFRWSSAWLFVPLISIAAYISGISEKEFFGDYPLVATSQVWVSLVVAAPLAAAWGSWDAGRLSGWLRTHCSGRDQLRALCVMLGGGLVAIVAAVVMVSLAASGLPGSTVAISIVVAGVVTMVAALMTGAALGLVLPRVFAAPLALTVWYAWMAAPIAADPGSWMKKVGVPGAVALCCTSDQQVSLSSMFGATLVGVACCLAAVASLLAVDRLRGIAFLASGLAAAGILGLVVANSSGATIVDRSTTLACASYARGSVCLWPEHRGQRVGIVREIEAVRQRLSQYPVNVPGSWSEAAAPAQGVGRLHWVSGMSGEEARSSLVVSIAQGMGCDDERGEALTAFLSRAAGGRPSAPIGESGGTTMSATKVQALPKAAQIAWVNQQVRGCR